MKTSLIALALSGLFSATSQAAPIQSEYFYQTESNLNQLNPTFKRSADSIATKSPTATSSSETETTQNILELTYERGLTDNYSVGGTLGYTTGSIDEEGATQETDLTGLNDVALFLKGQHSWMEGSSFHYGVTLGVSPGAQEVKDNEVTANTGGNIAELYVGHQWLVGSQVIGGRLFTGFDIGDRTVETTQANGTVVESEANGGNDTGLAAFYEVPHTMGAVGFVADYTTTSETEVTTSSTNTVQKNGGKNSIGLTVYSPYNFSDTATVIGSLGYRTLASSSIDGEEVDSGDTLNVRVTGRFSF